MLQAEETDDEVKSIAVMDQLVSLLTTDFCLNALTRSFSDSGTDAGNRAMTFTCPYEILTVVIAI